MTDDKHLPQSSFIRKFFRWGHFALPSMSIIFPRLTLTARDYWARICKRLCSPGIDSEESIQPADVAWRASTTNRVVVPARQAGNRFIGGSLKGLQIRALFSVLSYVSLDLSQVLSILGCPPTSLHDSPKLLCPLSSIFFSVHLCWVLHPGSHSFFKCLVSG